MDHGLVELANASAETTRRDPGLRHCTLDIGHAGGDLLLGLLTFASKAVESLFARRHAGGVDDELERRTCGHLFILGARAKAP